MTRPRLLDLYSGAGGSATGYHRAGFDVVGVDIVHQPRYPFPFIRADALSYLVQHGREFDAIHASPPCEVHSTLRALSPEKFYPDLIPATRAVMELCGKPWVIENVPGATLHHGVMLCGIMFGLRTYRHRWFETPFLIMQPHHPRHRIRAGAPARRAARGGRHISRPAAPSPSAATWAVTRASRWASTG